MANHRELMAGLQKDISGAEKLVERSAEGKGIARPKGETGVFAPRAIRIKGKLVGQKELASTARAFDKAIDELTKNVQFQSAEERTQARQALKTKFNEFQLETLKKGFEFESGIKERFRNQAARQAKNEMFAKITGSVIGAIVTGLPPGGGTPGGGGGGVGGSTPLGGGGGARGPRFTS